MDLVPEEAIAAIAQALCTDHGHSRQEGGMNCRTCSRRARVAAEVAAPLILAAELERQAKTLSARADQRVGDSLAAGERECNGDCDSSDCHSVSAVAAYSMAALGLRRRASVLRGEGDPK